MLICRFSLREFIFLELTVNIEHYCLHFFNLVFQYIDQFGADQPSHIPQCFLASSFLNNTSLRNSNYPQLSSNDGDDGSASLTPQNGHFMHQYLFISVDLFYSISFDQTPLVYFFNCPFIFLFILNLHCLLVLFRVATY